LAASLINPLILEQLDRLHEEFNTAKPFRHVVIDNFLRPEIAERMLGHFPSVEDPSKLLNEFGKPNPKSAISEVRSLAPIFVELDEYIQSTEFLRSLEKLTGIPDLRYDPWYYGAGTHENFHTAGLDAHYDFNIHPKTAYHRRLNAIVYLNKDWDPSWKGDIVFHSDAWNLKNDVKKSFTPDFNRCVIFETTESSWHSVTPVHLPPEHRHKSRKSFTIYLYTETRPSSEIAPEHGTVYVQSNLRPHIREGYTLTAQDMEEIQANLQRRNDYLRNMYKREYRFSEVIDDLRRQVSEWKSTSYVPVVGRIKLKHVTVPMFHDGWVGKEFRATVELREPIRGVSANVWLPGSVAPVEVRLCCDGLSERKLVRGGLSTLRIRLRKRRGDLVEVALAAEPVRIAAANDSREITIILDSIVFQKTAKTMRDHPWFVRARSSLKSRIERWRRSRQSPAVGASH